MKKDPLLLLTARITDFLRDEWIKITGTILVVVLIVGISFFFVQSRAKGELNAYDAALTAMQNDAPETTDLLNRVVKKYDGTQSAAEALIFLGNRYYQKDDLENSEKCYVQYIKKYAKDPIYGFNAYNNLGSIYEEKEKFKEAAELYEKFNEKFMDSIFTSMMYLNAGKAYLHAGDKESAKRNFLKITMESRDSKQKQEALYYMELIK